MFLIINMDNDGNDDDDESSAIISRCIFVGSLMSYTPITSDH